MERDEEYEVVFYTLAVLALAAIVIPIKWPRANDPLAFAALVVASVTLGLGGWIAYAGGKVRHSEFRTSQPPAVEAYDDEDEHEP